VTCFNLARCHIVSARKPLLGLVHHFDRCVPQKRCPALKTAQFLFGFTAIGRAGIKGGFPDRQRHLSVAGYLLRMNPFAADEVFAAHSAHTMTVC
jgi:hypothetical protein